MGTQGVNLSYRSWQTGLGACQGSWDFLFCRVTESKQDPMQPGSSPENRGCTRAPTSVTGRLKNHCQLSLVQGLHEAVVLGRQRTQHGSWPGIKSSYPLTAWQHICHCFNITMGQELPDKTCWGLRELGGSTGLAGRRVKKGGQGGEWWQNRFYDTKTKRDYYTLNVFFSKKNEESCGVQDTIKPLTFYVQKKWNKL